MPAPNSAPKTRTDVISDRGGRSRGGCITCTGGVPAGSPAAAALAALLARRNDSPKTSANMFSTQQHHDDGEGGVGEREDAHSSKNTPCAHGQIQL